MVDKLNAEMEYQRAEQAMSRVRKLEARVEELESHREDLEVSRSQAVAEKDRYLVRVAKLWMAYCDMAERAGAIPVGLEARLKPQPMSEAPRDGTELQVLVRVRYCDGEWHNVRDDGVDDCEGWLPLPDQPKEGE
ncbi:MAG: hypothetical protein ACE5NA_13395 [Nitrospiraceae bacterium]